MDPNAKRIIDANLALGNGQQVSPEPELTVNMVEVPRADGSVSLLPSDVAAVQYLAQISAQIAAVLAQGKEMADRLERVEQRFGIFGRKRG